MAYYQKTLIIGNVGKDPETRHINGGKQVCSFSVAVTKKWRGSDNEMREKTTWYRVAAWARLADVCQQYVKKGMSVMVEGTCEASAFMGQDGQPQASLELTVRDIQFLGNRNSQQQDNSQQQQPDDLPF